MHGFLISGGGSGSGGGTATPAGSTTDVQFNSGGALAADTGNLTYASGLLKAPTVSATTLNSQYASITTIYNPGSLSANAIAANSVSSTLVSATNISGSLIQIGTGNSATCSGTIKGAIRYSNTSSTLEYCNSTAWTSLGPSATTVPSFSVTKGGSNQTVVAGVGTLLTWSTEVFDTNSNFASNRFTPTIAGKYLFTLNVYCNGGTAIVCAPMIYKTGSRMAQAFTAGGSTDAISSVSMLLDMNGTTDYVEAFVQNINGTGIFGDASTNFTGILIAPYGSGGGDATPGGTDTQVQFNDGGSALGGDADYTWNKTSNVLNITGLISTTNISATNLHVTGTLRIPSVTTAAAVGAGGNRIASGTTNVTALNGGSVTFTTAGSERMVIGSYGFVGLGTPSPRYTMEVSGTVSANILTFSSVSSFGTSVCRSGADANGFMLLGPCTSLSEYKDKVQDLSLGLGTALQLRPVEFNWIAGKGGQRDLGFIAEEVNRVSPLLGQYDNGKLTGVRYEQMSALLVKSVQELKAANDNLVSETATLRTELKAANDNYLELKCEVEGLRRAGGGKR